jgi:hypothetical protein
LAVIVLVLFINKFFIGHNQLKPQDYADPIKLLKDKDRDWVYYNTNDKNSTFEMFISFLINDSEEFSNPDGTLLIDKAGNKYSTAPVMINNQCTDTAYFYFSKDDYASMFLIFDKTYKSLTTSGLALSKITIISMDFENREELARCVIVGEDWHNITFYSYRNYTHSWFDARIGDYPK